MPAWPLSGDFSSESNDAAHGRYNFDRGLIVMLLKSRRAALCQAGIVSMSALLSRSTFRQAPFDSARTLDAITPETRQAIERGLAWLARRQIVSGREEGAFGHGG